MAGAKVPRPEGTYSYGQAIDLGTLARTHAPLPGPIRLYAGDTGPQAQPSAQAQKSSPKLGISVPKSSKISAADWVSKIKACDDVPDYFKEQIKTKDGIIFVTNPKRFAYPKNVIAKDWLDDWLSAFTVEEWEMTTGSLEISVKRGDPKPQGELNPDLSSGDKIDGLTKWAGLTMGAHDKFAVEYGNTFTGGVTLGSGRSKLIVITNRVTLKLGDKIPKHFTVTDSELVNTWFHEIACHAGPDTAGTDSVHGNAKVDACAADINRTISKRVTTNKIFDEIDSFSNPPKATHP